jgi:hypothetical protein
MESERQLRVEEDWCAYRPVVGQCHAGKLHITTTVRLPVDVSALRPSPSAEHTEKKHELPLPRAHFLHHNPTSSHYGMKYEDDVEPSL